MPSCQVRGFRSLSNLRQNDLRSEIHGLTDDVMDYLDELPSRQEDLSIVMDSLIPVDDEGLVDEMHEAFPKITGGLLRARQIFRGASVMSRIMDEGDEEQIDFLRVREPVERGRKPTAGEFRRDFQETMRRLDNVIEWGEEFIREGEEYLRERNRKRG